MSDLPVLDKALARNFPFEARLDSPHGSLRRGSLNLTNGVALKILGRLAGGGYLALYDEGVWVRVPEHWIKREGGAYTERPQ
jgi:hypothetical protein